MPAPSPERSLAGRRILVTGGGGGMGMAIGRALAHAGAEVDLAARSGPTGDMGEGMRALSLDVTNPSAVAALGATPFDGLVHSAAAFAEFARLEHGTAEADDRVFEVGIRAALALVRAVLPGMRARGFGRIVLIGSAAADRGGFGQAAYAASKAAYVGLVRTIASEAGREGVTANVVAPGLVETPRLLRSTTPEARDAVVGATAAGRIGQPEEIAGLVAYLMGPTAGFLTGAVIPVDGGLGLGVSPRHPSPPDSSPGSSRSDLPSGESGP